MKTVLIILFLIVLLLYVPLPLYLSLRLKGANISFFKLIAFRLQKVPLGIINRKYQQLISLKINIDFENLTYLYKQGYDLDNILRGIKKALENGLFIDLESACKFDKENIDISRTVLNTLSNVDQERRK